MRHERDEWILRIKAVEREHSAIRFATDRLLNDVRADPTILDADLRPRDVVSASDGVDGTYVVRLFAEFETGLRLFWSSVRDTVPRTRDLLDGIAAMRGIPDFDRANADAVREYRNNLVHEREEEFEPIPVKDSRAYLCRFFSFLPRIWGE
jgi:hypothetical protein